jgi:hypothetical protein
LFCEAVSVAGATNPVTVGGTNTESGIALMVAGAFWLNTIWVPLVIDRMYAVVGNPVP